MAANSLVLIGGRGRPCPLCGCGTGLARAGPVDAAFETKACQQATTRIDCSSRRRPGREAAVRLPRGDRRLRPNNNSPLHDTAAHRLTFFGVVSLVVNQKDGACHFRSTAFRTTISLK